MGIKSWYEGRKSMKEAVKLFIKPLHYKEVVKTPVYIDKYVSSISG